ncbi:MAG TPA: hemolysin family protein [Solirubrobacteraceae bacterium]|nr:hemolysin family protein [Solirubrobacteraceae bacterium]
MNGLKLVITALLIALNAFFVIAEYALVRSRRARLEVLRDEGARGASRALDQLGNVNEYISAVQIGVTACSIGIGALGAPALTSLLEGIFPSSVSHGIAVTVSVIVAFAIITSVQLIGGEMVPKFYAIDRAENVARRVARPLEGFDRLFRPIVMVVTAVAGRILRLLGIDMREQSEVGSSEELKRLIAESQVGGQIDPGEAGMLRGVFHLHEQEARQVMTPIPAVDTIDISDDAEGALRASISSGHTRLVVTEDEDRDRVRGIVHVSELARLFMQKGAQAPLDGIVHEALIVPETKPLDDLLADLQRERASMAVVVDEYGRVVGVVSVEDIVEEIVGEITDETDPSTGEIRRLANGDWFVRGHVAIADLADYGLELPVDSDAYNSVGGFVFAELGRLPRRGDTVNTGGFSIRVESVRDNRVEAVRIRERRVARSREGSDEA